MNLAFNEKLNQFDEYTYEFNQGGILDIKLQGKHTFTIVLLNGKFYEVKCSLNNDTTDWDRNEWIAISAIGEKIIELEERAKNSK